MNTAERRATAALWSIQGVGPVTLHELSARFGELGSLLDVPIASWAPLCEWRGQAAEHLSTLQCLAQRADRLEQQCRALQASILFPGDRGWPDRMDDVGGLPPVLFARGPGADAPRRRRVAIVGSRLVDTNTLERLETIAAEVARQGVGVVSGAAIGCDISAHKGALTGKGETWAFLGNALDQIDSPQREITARIVDAGHTLFSQFPPGSRANQSSFTLRNRLISAASDAVLVFRAGEGSGALHTARAALAQGRPLLATPADPWNEAAISSNALLQEGARAQLSVDDILDAVGATSLSPPPAAKAFDPTAVSPAAARVFELLRRGPTDFDDLAAALPELGPGRVSAALVELEVHGAVQHVGTRCYEKR